MKFVARTLLLMITGAVFLISCAGGPKTKETPPEWVSNPPKADDTYMYFVGSGTDAAGNMSEAEQTAVTFLIDEITRYLGVEVKTSTTAEARATLDSFETDIKSEVTQETTSQVAGFKVVDRWIRRSDDGNVTVYILGRYNKNDLQKEKQRIKKVFEEREEAISGPAKEAKQLQMQGRYFEAVQKYVQAAAAAADSSVQNAKIKFKENIDNAKNILQNISIITVNNNLSTQIGQQFAEPFTAKVVYGGSQSDPGIPGAGLRISYKVMRSNGRLGIRSKNMQTDDTGKIQFDYPSPEFVGSETVMVQLDLQAFIEPLVDIPDSYMEQVLALEDVVASKQAKFNFSVVSNAKNIPTGVLVLEVDSAGNPMDTTDTRSGITEALSEEGFQVQSIAIDPAKIADASESDIISMVKEAAGEDMERAIFGTVRLENFNETDSGFLVKVGGTVKTAELASGKILYSTNQFKRARGSNLDSALSSAFRNLGKSIGEEMVNNLP